MTLCLPNSLIDLQHPISSGHVELPEPTVPLMSESGNWQQIFWNWQTKIASISERFWLEVTESKSGY